MLEIDGVSLAFGGITALDEVSCTVAEGDCYGLVGPNGAGKTALLNCICGVYRPRSGAIRFYGRPITNLPIEQISALGLGRTFQSMDHFSEFTVRDYVMLGRIQHVTGSSVLSALRWPPTVRRERRERAVVEEYLARCGLAEHAGEVLAEVPYGTQKLVDVCRVLCSEVRWALLDEPTSGTTSDERPAISAALDLLVEHGTTVVVVDHDVDFVARHARRLTALDQGRVLSTGPTREVLDDPAVRRIYFGLVNEQQVLDAEQRADDAAAG